MAEGSWMSFADEVANLSAFGDISKRQQEEAQRLKTISEMASSCCVAIRDCIEQAALSKAREFQGYFGYPLVDYEDYPTYRFTLLKNIDAHHFISTHDTRIREKKPRLAAPPFLMESSDVALYKSSVNSLLSHRCGNPGNIKWLLEGAIEETFRRMQLYGDVLFTSKQRDALLSTCLSEVDGWGFKSYSIDYIDKNVGVPIAYSTWSGKLKYIDIPGFYLCASFQW